MTKSISELEADRERLIARQKRLETRIAGAKSKQVKSKRKMTDDFFLLYGQYVMCFSGFNKAKENLGIEDYKFAYFKEFLWKYFEIKDIQDEKKRERAIKKIDKIMERYKDLMNGIPKNYEELIKKYESLNEKRESEGLTRYSKVNVLNFK